MGVDCRTHLTSKDIDNQRGRSLYAGEGTKERVHRFGDFELRVPALDLRLRGQSVSIRFTPLRVLAYLIEHHDRIVSKEELLETLWPETSVSDASLSTALKEVRSRLGDTGATQRWIRTERKRGFRFIGPISTDSNGTSGQCRLYGMPRGLSLSFVGRDQEIQELEALLESPSYAGTQISIEGMPGVGKTELALQLAHKLSYEGRFPGGIFWLEGQSRDLRREWGTQIADQYGLPDGVADRTAEILRRIDTCGARTLLILDNVEAWTPRSPRPLPTGVHVQILATTRVRKLGGAGFRHLELGSLRPPYDRELILRIADREPERGLEELLAHLEGHALAIELAGVFLGTYRGETPLSYLAELQRSPNATEALGQTRVRYERTAMDAFRQLWDRFSAGTRHAWRLAACFAPEPATRPLARAVGMDDASMRRLEDFHLIRTNSEGRWSMHRLARRFAQSVEPAAEFHGAQVQFAAGCANRASEIGQAGIAVYLDDHHHFEAALRSNSEVLSDETAIAVGRTIGAHLDPMRDQAEPLLRATLQRARSTGKTPVLLEALENISKIASARGDHRLALQWTRQIEDLTDRSPSLIHRVTALRTSGEVAVFWGRHREAQDKLAEGIALGSCTSDLSSGSFIDRRASMLSYSAVSHVLCGHPDSALRLGELAIERALALDHLPSLCVALLLTNVVLFLRGDFTGVWTRSEMLMASVHRRPELGLDVYIRRAHECQAAARGLAGDTSRAEQIQKAICDLIAGPQLAFSSVTLAVLAEASLGCADPSSARVALKSGLEFVSKSGELFIASEIFRVAARTEQDLALRMLLLQTALQICLRQRARWLILRAATAQVDNVLQSPPCLSEQRVYDMYRRLHRAHGRISEGKDLPDMRSAQATLERAGSALGCVRSAVHR